MQPLQKGQAAGPGERAQPRQGWDGLACHTCHACHATCHARSRFLSGPEMRRRALGRPGRCGVLS